MQSKMLLTISGIVLVVAAAFAGGYYINKSGKSTDLASNPAPYSTPAAPAPVASSQSAPLAPSQPQTAALPSAETGSAEPPPSNQRRSQAPDRRYSDFADRDYGHRPPPPPPPSSQAFTDQGPNPFEGRFATFPVQYSGQGTEASPASWVAHTEWGSDHSADLRIALVVPEPRNNDAFWGQWRDRQRSDMMPDVTYGTPVFVAGTVSVLVNVDARRLDLETPAKLTVSGQDGTRIYRSSTVVPARGDNWDQRGVRWLFASDADLYRALRHGADTTVIIRYRGRDEDHDIRIPFATAEFANSARAFEAELRQRLPQIANDWERTRPEAAAGQPPPPNGTNGDNGRRGREQIVAYRPPADNCGPQPQPVTANPDDYMGYSQIDLDRAQASLSQLKTWLDCRQQWIGQYQNSINELDQKMAQPGQPPSQAVRNAQGGQAVLAQLDNARQRQSETQRLLITHTAKLNEARKRASDAAQLQGNRSAPPRPEKTSPSPVTPAQPPAHKPQAMETPPSNPVKPSPAAPVAAQNKPAAPAQQQTAAQPPLHKPQTAEAPPANPVKPSPATPAAAQNKPAGTTQQQTATPPSLHKPQTAETLPANPVKTPPPTQTNTQQIVLNFHAPDDTCGGEPSFASSDPATYQNASPADLKAATAAIEKVGTWVRCRQQWLVKYQAAIDDLGHRIDPGSDPQHAVMGAPGGAQIIANYNDAKRHTEEKRIELQHQATILMQGRATAHKPDAQPNRPAPQKNGAQPIQP